MINFREKANFIWSVADLLRGDYKQADYGKVILPMTVLRRMDCVLAPTKSAVLERYETIKKENDKTIDAILNQVSGQRTFHNRSKFDFEKLAADDKDIAANLRNYIAGFSAGAREIIEYFNFDEEITHLDDANLLYLVVKRFSEFDLTEIAPLEMGYIFEELIRKFAELSNETAGEHFTPREVIELMVNVLFISDRDVLTKEGIVRTLYDPACGTGGMLSVADKHLNNLNPHARLELFGQELNNASYAICKSDMLIKGQKADNIKRGNSFSGDGLHGEHFDYLLSNPPFGVEWKKVEKVVRDEHEKKGLAGRFGAGLPRISDGSLLFLQHMISKMKPEDGGSRIGIVFNGSPLFTGSAGSGESNIRKWIIENDWLEAIIALPDQLFYNTGIFTYIWIVTNRKHPQRRGKVQLVNAVGFYEKMPKSLGNKRNYITEEQIAEITRIYGDFKEGEYCKIFDNADFGYSRITVERPLRLNFQISRERVTRLEESSAFANLAKSRKKGEVGKKEAEAGKQLQEKIIDTLLRTADGKLYKNREEFTKTLKRQFKEVSVTISAALLKTIITALSERDETAEICANSKGDPEADPELRDYENVPLKEDIQTYFEREVLPHVPDAWIDHSKTKTGYEINFTKYFYQYKPLRSLAEIRADILKLEEKTEGMIREILE